MKAIIGLAVLLAACSDPKAPVTGTTEQIDTSISAPVTNTISIDSNITGCFSQIYNRDTAMLQLDAKGLSITGPLSYNYHEKDRNEGSFTGEVSGKLLMGWYLFKSEGVVSVRQTIFRIENGQLLPGMGEMNERNDSLVFNNPADLTFDNTRAFKKVACML